MTITFVSGSAADNGSGSSSINVIKPNGIQDNDILIAYLSADGASNVGNIPSGFTLMGSGATGSTADNYGAWGYKIVTDATSEPANYFFSFALSARAAAGIEVYRGVNTSNPIGAHSFQSSYGAQTSFATLEHPYNPHAMVFLVMGGDSASVTFSSQDTINYPIVERRDTTSSGGGPGTAKVHIAAADALDGNEFVSGGIPYAYGGWYNYTPSGGNGGLIATVVLNAIDVLAIGGATTFDTNVSLVETLVSPLQFTYDKMVAFDSHQPTIWSQPRLNPQAGKNTLDTIYELPNGKFASVYVEYDDRWANNATMGREMMGRFISFQSYENYTKFGEKEADFIFTDTYGAGGLDSTRFSEDIFVVYTGHGHTYPWTGTYNYYLDYGPRARVVKYDPNTNTFSKIGSDQTIFPSYDRQTQLGTVTRTGPSTVVFTGGRRRNDVNLGVVSTYGARVLHIDEGTGTLTLGTVWPVFESENTGTHNWQTQVAHIDDTKILFFYFDDIANNYVARVGLISTDVNGKPTVLTLSSTTSAAPDMAASTSNTVSTGTTFPLMKPIALSSTEGIYLHRPLSNTKTLVLRPYTINVDDTVTFETPITIKDAGTGFIYAYAAEKIGAYIAVVYSYQDTSTNTYKIEAKYLHADTFAEHSSEVLASNAVTYYNGLHISPGLSIPTYHLKYILATDVRRPFFETFSTPISNISNTVDAYIPVNDPNPLDHTTPLTCFIQTEGIYGSQSAYVGAPADNTIGSTNLFVWGWGILSESVLAFINYIDPLEVSQNCFIQAGVSEGSLNAFVSGPDIITSGAELFVHGYDSTLNTLYAYIEGTEVFTASNVGAIRLQKSLSQRIEFDDNLNIRPTQEVTVNFWMKAYDLSDGSRPGFLIKDYGSSRSIGIFEGANGTRKWHYGVDTTTGWSASDTVGNWVADTWYMVTLRYNGSTVSFFVNGQLDSSFAKTGDIRWDTGIWNVGFRPNTGEYTNMAFSRFDLWNYALTDQEIEDLFGYGTYTTVGAFIDGDEPEILDDSVWSYIVSIESNANPFNISSGQMALIPYDGVIDSQSCYLVGPPLHVVNHDLKIVLDNFEYARHDLVMRVNGQGETVLTKITGAIEYPITREASVYLGKLFFSDMPGVEYNSQSCFLVGGINLDHTTEMRVFIQSQSYGVNFLQSYVHGDFTALNASKADCFIVCDQINEYMSAYIVNDQADVTGEMYLYIAAPIYSVDGDAPSFIHGWDQFTSGPARAYVHTIDAMSGFAQMFITAGEVLSKDTPTGQYVFIPANAQVFDPAQNCYVYGAYVELGTQNCFIMAQPTIETPDVDCYIEAPYPFVPVQEMLMWTHGNEPLSDSTLCYIQGNPNIISDSSSDMGSFIWGWVIVDVRQLLYIQNIQIFPASPLKQNLYIASAVESTGTIGCFIAGQQETGYVCAYITNSDSSANMSVSKKCYIVGQGDTSPILSAFVSGILVIQTDLNNPFLPTYIVG